MSRSLIISIVLHIVFFLFLAVWGAVSGFYPRKIDVYRVQLVTPPPAPKKVTMDEKKPAQVPAPKPEPPKPEKKIEKEAPTTSIPRKEKKAEKTAEKPEQPETGKQVKVDTEDFPFSYYLNLLRYRVYENWNPPYQKGEGERILNAVVGFRVHRNGKISEIKVENPSDQFLYDQAAQRAVYAAGQLPPLPEEFPGEYLTVHIEFEVKW